MAGVYNRKLFRQSSARDELRKIGGIMASSEDLLQEAIRTAEQAPRSEGISSMVMPSQAPAPMPMAQPMMQQPMMGQPMMQQPMGQPMMQQPMGQPMMQQPMMAPAPMQQPVAQQPAYMPPMMPPSVQPQGFKEGGAVSPFPGRAAGIATPKLTEVDISRAAGRAPNVEVDPELLDTAKAIAMRLEDEPPHAVATRILAEARARGVETTSDKVPPDQAEDAMRSDLASIYENLTGDPAAYEKNIDQLNRGIIGAAIGAGTSARATENISKGLLVGLEAAKETEERRVKDARALQLAQLQARAKGAGGVGSRDYRNPVDAYQDAYQSVMNAGEFDLQIPEGMTREEYADQVATALITRSYSPEQLVGTPFEGLGGADRTASPAAGATQTAEDVLQSARQAIAAGAPEDAVRERLAAMGIDPGAL